jgi:glycine C-acetyltransferase
MYESLKQQLQGTLDEIRSAGLYKGEREIDSAQGSHILSNQENLLNFCANNYLGLANDSRIINAAKQVLDDRGFGVASVRFICGTQDIHKELEDEVSKFLGTDDTILFSSCFDANGGVFESLFDDQR